MELVITMAILFTILTKPSIAAGRSTTLGEFAEFIEHELTSYNTCKYYASEMAHYIVAAKATPREQQINIGPHCHAWLEIAAALTNWLHPAFEHLRTEPKNQITACMSILMYKYGFEQKYASTESTYFQRLMKISGTKVEDVLAVRQAVTAGIGAIIKHPELKSRVDQALTVYHIPNSESYDHMEEKCKRFVNDKKKRSITNTTSDGDDDESS